VKEESPARYRSSAQHCLSEERARHVFLSFLLQNVVKFKNKCAPVTLKKCALFVLTIISHPQSHKPVPLRSQKQFFNYYSISGNNIAVYFCYIYFTNFPMMTCIKKLQSGSGSSFDF